MTMTLPCRCVMELRHWQTCTVQRNPADTPFWLPLLLIRDRFKTLAPRQALSKRVQVTASFLAAMYMSSRIAEVLVVPVEPLAFSTARNAMTCTISSSGLRNNRGRMAMSA